MFRCLKWEDCSTIVNLLSWLYRVSLKKVTHFWDNITPIFRRVHLYSVHLPLCSDVRAYLGHRRIINARVPGFVFDRMMNTPATFNHARENMVRLLKYALTSLHRDIWTEYSLQIFTAHEGNGAKYVPKVTGDRAYYCPTPKVEGNSRPTVSSHRGYIFCTIARIKSSKFVLYTAFYSWDWEHNFPWPLSQNIRELLVKLLCKKWTLPGGDVKRVTRGQYTVFIVKICPVMMSAMKYAKYFLLSIAVSTNQMTRIFSCGI